MSRKISAAADAPVIQKNIIVQKLNLLIQILKNRHVRHYRDSYFHFWADLILAGILLGLVITFIWLVLWQPRSEFELEVRTASARIVSGETQEFIINYKNDEGNAINGATLEIDLPKHFVLEDSAPSNSFNKESNTFSLGDLANGARGEVRILGIVQGEISERQFFGLNLTYQNKNFKKQVLSSLVYSIDASVIELNVTIPETAYRGIPFSASVDVKNTGQAALHNVSLSFSGGWNITPDNETFENNAILIPLLKAGETKHIAFSALTMQPALTEIDFSINSSLLINTVKLNQTISSHRVSVLEPSLGVTASFKNTSFSGSALGLSVAFRNSESATISDLSFKAESRRSTASIKSFNLVSGNFSLRDNALAYNQDLKAGESGRFESSIQLDRKEIVLNDFLNISLQVSYRMNDKEYAYEIALPVLKIDSNLTVNSAGYYYGPQGDQLGIGPIPPKVGIPTTYWIIWEANNLGNDLSRFQLTADLPANVVWLDQTSVVAGVVSYSPVGRRVLWNIDSIPKTGGNYRLSFAVSIVPGESELGTVPNLVNTIQFTAKDSYTDAQIMKKLANITTNIESDTKASGKGIVEPTEQ